MEVAQVNGGSTFSVADAITIDQETIALQSSTDWTDTFVDLSGNTTFENIDSAEFRIYYWGAIVTNSVTSRVNIDNLVIEGFVVYEPSSAVLMSLGGSRSYCTSQTLDYIVFSLGGLMFLASDHFYFVLTSNLIFQ